MNIQVIGAGSWGLALARLLALNGHAVQLWCRQEDAPEELHRNRKSKFYLQHVTIPESVSVAPSSKPDAEIAVFAVPSHAMRAMAEKHSFSSRTIRVSVAKGIENDSLLRMSEVLREVHGECPIVALSGPSHAEEVAEDKPTSVVVAGDDPRACETVQKAFMSQRFRVYTSRDIVGVELGGALKNVVALAAGVCDGLELGDNAKAALITRGLAEIARLGTRMGANPLTFAGLSGLGDLVVTCASRLSRNRWVGEQIARGIPLDRILGNMTMVAEGVKTARSGYALSMKFEVEMPITRQVYRTLFENADPVQAVTELMTREAKPEWG